MDAKEITDTELANAIVGHGVGHLSPPGYYGLFWIGPDDSPTYLKTSEFVRDGRVAMAMMEKLIKRGYSFLLATMPDGKAIMTVTSPLPNQKEWAAQVVDDSLPRAIIEACCEALK